VLDPSRPREVLCDLPLRPRDDPSLVVENDRAGAGRALVEGEQERHPRDDTGEGASGRYDRSMAREPAREDLATAVDSCACFQLRRASRAVTQLYDAALQPAGLRSTQFVILAVIRVDEPVRQDELASLLGMERSTLSRNLKPLTESGYVARARAPGERATRLRLTAKGRRKVVESVPLWERVQRSFTSQMGASRWDVLRRRLKDAAEAARRD
jgi:DNA-binding MarR family transcriptional regulator